MGYLIKAPLGLGMFVGGIVLFNVKLVSLLQTGTCASGNTPYEIANPCPSGTGTDILLLMASIFGGLIGAALFAGRGDPPWSKDRPVDPYADFSWGWMAWAVFFTATGATSLIVSLTNETVKASQGGQLGGIIVGATFLVMGVPVLLLSIWWAFKDLTGRTERPAVANAASTASSAGGGSGLFGRSSFGSGFGNVQQMARNLPWMQTGGGGSGSGAQIAKLERLQKLRESGALTDAEFQREKAKILSES